MKKYFALGMMVFFSSGSVAVSTDSWEAFCAKQSEPIILNYCVKVDRVCELAGFESDRCSKARQDAMAKPAHPGKLEK